MKTSKKNASDTNEATWQIINNNMGRNKHKTYEKFSITNDNKY